MAPLYNAIILRWATRCADFPRLPIATGSSDQTARPCGSRLQLDVALSDSRIEGIGFAISACALGQASAALLATHARGASPADVAQAEAELRALLCGRHNGALIWPDLTIFTAAADYPSRHPAILLPYVAFADALNRATDITPSDQATKE